MQVKHFHDMICIPELWRLKCAISFLMSFLFVQVKRFHYRDLYSLLTADQKAAMPVLDPTQGKRHFV